MYNVSQDYLDNISKNGRIISWYGTITLEDGETVYNFDTSNMYLDNFGITAQACSGDFIEIGTTNSAELNLALVLTEVSGTYYLDGKTVNRYDLYNAIVEVNFRLYFEDSTYEDVPMGVYIVTEPIRTNKKLSLKCYDLMTLFNVHSDSIGSGTPYQILTFVCDLCGVEFGNTEAQIEAMPNGDVTFYEYETNNVNTYRDVIGMVAQLLCGVAVMGRDGKLYIRQYGMSVTRVCNDDVTFTLETADYETFYTAISAYSIDDEENVTERNETDNGLLYDIGTNCFLQGSNLTDYLSDILGKLDDIRYTPFASSIVGDPALDLLDVVEFGAPYIASGSVSAITSITYTYTGLQIECSGANPDAKEVKSNLASTINNASNKAVPIRHYTFTNAADVEIEDGESATAVYFHIVSRASTWFAFECEIKHTAETTEEEDTDTYTENDLVLTAKVYLNGVLLAYEPVTTEQDGVRLLHLSRSFNVEVGPVIIEVVLECDGGAVSIESGDANAYLWGTHLEELKLLRIDVAQPPRKYLNYVDEPIDYSGVKIVGTYQDSSSIDLTSDCTFSPADGTISTEEATVTVLVEYEE